MERVTFAIMRLAVVMTFGLLTAACATSASHDAATADLAREFLQASGLSGLAVSVGTTQEIIWSQGFGFADLEQGVPVNASATKFRVGSTAKSMTAVAVGQLHERGKLDLDLPIQSYVPEFPQKSGAVTTRLLAGHLAGVRHYSSEEEFLSTRSYQSVTDALSIFANDALLFEPGTQFQYSTYGYNLISAVIERAAGEDFLNYMTRNVFAPSGMAATEADRVTPLIANRSRYYTKQDGELVNAAWVDNSNKWAGGGFLSTADDLVRFGQSHLSDKLLRPETIEMMWTSQKTSDGSVTGYGLGWFIDMDDAQRRVVRHSGGSVGGITELRIYPDQGLVVAVITNTAPANVRDLAEKIAEYYLSDQAF